MISLEAWLEEGVAFHRNKPVLRILRMGPHSILLHCNCTRGESCWVCLLIYTMNRSSGCWVVCVWGSSLETRSHVVRVDIEHPILLPLPKCGDNGECITVGLDQLWHVQNAQENVSLFISLTGNGDRIGVSTRGTAQQLGGHDNLQTAGHMWTLSWPFHPCTNFFP